MKTPYKDFKLKQKAGDFDFVVLNVNRGCFVVIDPETKKEYGTLKGVNPVLKRIFYSNYCFDNKNMITPENLKKYKSKNKKPDNLGVELGPISRGKIVHDQINLLSDKKFEKLYKSKYTYIDPMTEFFYDWMKIRKLRPVICELPICDPSIKLGTAADMIARDLNGNLYLIEVKTGNLKTFNSYNGLMESGLSDLNNSPYNQGRLQLVITCQILKRIYSINIKRCFLVHLSDDGVNEKIIDDNMMKVADTIYDIVVKKICNVDN